MQMYYVSKIWFFNPIITSFEIFIPMSHPNHVTKQKKHPAELHTTICRALQNKCMFPAILVLHLKEWVLQINTHFNRSCETFNKGQYRLPSLEHLVQLCFKMDETILFSILLASRDIQSKHTTLIVNPTRSENYIYHPLKCCIQINVNNTRRNVKGTNSILARTYSSSQYYQNSFSLLLALHFSFICIYTYSNSIYCS